MDAQSHALTAEEEVSALLESYFDAIRASDLERIVAHYAPDVIAYDAIGQFEFSGRDAYEAHWKVCLEMCQTMSFEPRTPVIAASGDVAFAHCLIRCGATDLDGKEQSGWVRATITARKANDRWHIVHEHYSMPFDPESGKVLGMPEPGES